MKCSARPAWWLRWLVLTLAVLALLALQQIRRERSRSREEAAALAVDQALGATFEALDDDLAADLGVSRGASGLLVTSLAEGQAVDRAGVLPGDVIEQIGQFAVPDIEAAADALKADRGRRLDLIVNRRGEELRVTVTLEPATGQWLFVLEKLEETAR